MFEQGTVGIFCITVGFLLKMDLKSSTSGKMRSGHRGVLACSLPACSWLSAARSPGVLGCRYADNEHQHHKQLHWSHWRWFWSSMWCLSNVVSGHRKTPETCLWDIVIKMQASWDTHKCPLQATEHTPAACWSALEKIARGWGHLFCSVLQGPPVARRTGRMQLEPCLSFLVQSGVGRAEHGYPTSWDGSQHCPGHGIHRDNPQPLHIPASQSGNWWTTFSAINPP